MSENSSVMAGRCVYPLAHIALKLYLAIVILNFADKTTEDIFNGLDSKAARRIPQTVWPVAVRKLDMLYAAADLRDLRVPPSNRLQALKGKWFGYYSVRINDQYRIVFQWTDGNVKNVQITDYH
jgi:proteic killer suppression protein